MLRLLLPLALLSLFVTSVCAKPITVTGRLLGADGSAMAAAGILLVAPADMREKTEFVAVGPDGSFTLTVAEPGVYQLVAHGVDHERLVQPMLLADETAVALDIRLGTYAIAETFDSLRVIGTFNDYSFEKGAVMMTRQADGTFLAEIPTTEPAVTYQLLGVVPDHSVNGTDGRAWHYDGGGDYESTVDVKSGVARIVFDPKKRAAPRQIASVTARDPSSKVATYLRIHAEMARRSSAMRADASAWEASGKPMKEWKYDNAAELLSIVALVKSERDPFTRQLLLLSYIDARTSTARDSAIAQLAAKEIEPESMLWSLGTHRIFDMYRYKGSLKTPLTLDEYLERASDRHPSTSVRADVLQTRMRMAKYQNDTIAVARLYGEFMQKYSAMPFAESVVAEYSPDRAIMVGKKVPQFSFASLTDPSVMYTDQSMLGRYYLIDFWATWCGPCIGEMENMHQAYDKFRGKNFEILSLSFDASPQEVTKFVADKWKMPWSHTFIEGGFSNPASKTFGVTGIPKPILVGPDGTIVATEEVLRGETLEKTLAKFLAAGSTGAGAE